MAAALAATIVALLSGPASSHCFSKWNYPWAQRCSKDDPPKKDKTWFVEITQPPLAAISGDRRTEQEIKDQIEHDAAVAAHKDELNELLRQQQEKEREGIE